MSPGVHDDIKPTILSIGSFITENFGDQALSRALRERLVNDLHATVITFPVKAPEATLGPRNLGLVKKMLLALRFLPAHYLRLYTLAKRADCAVIGGGHLLHDLTRGTAPQFFFTCLTLRLARCPFHVFAVGVGPIDRMLSRWFFGLACIMAHKVAVRDTLSSRILARCPGHGVFLSDQLAPDLAFTLFPEPPLRRPVRGVIGVNPIAHMKPEVVPGGRLDCYNSYLDRMSEFIQVLLRITDRTVLLFSTVPWEDEDTVLAIGERFDHTPRVEVARPGTLEEGIATVSSVDFLFATRLHTLIFGLAQGVPAIAFSDHPRIRGLMSDLDSDDLLYGINDFPIDATDLQRVLNDLCGTRAETLVKKVQEHARFAERALSEELLAISKAVRRRSVHK